MNLRNSIFFVVLISACLQVLNIIYPGKGFNYLTYLMFFFFNAVLFYCVLLKGAVNFYQFVIFIFLMLFVLLKSFINPSFMNFDFVFSAFIYIYVIFCLSNFKLPTENSFAPNYEWLLFLILLTFSFFYFIQLQDFLVKSGEFESFGTNTRFGKIGEKNSINVLSKNLTIMALAILVLLNKKRIVLIIPLFILLVGIILTQSRSSALILLTFLILYYKLNLWLLFPVFCFYIYFNFLFSNSEFVTFIISRLLNFSFDSDMSLLIRFENMQIAFMSNPFWGLEEPFSVLFNRSADNLFANMLSKFGLVLSVLYSIFFIVGLLKLYKINKYSLTILTLFFIYGTSDGDVIQLSTFFSWFLLLISLKMKLVSVRESK